MKKVLGLVMAALLPIATRKSFIFIIMAFLTLCGIGAKTNYYTNGGWKVMYSTSTLKASDFEGTNFFLKDTPNKWYKDLNIQVFNKVHSNGTGYGNYDYEISRIIGANKGEAILIKGNRIVYAVYNKSVKEFVICNFTFTIDNAEYERRKENLAYYAKCIDNIEWCEWTIENCSSPTIRKSEVVQVPYTYTERVWHPGTLGYSTYHRGSQASSSGYYETVTRTAYRDEVRYYNASNPNYDLDAVAKARQYLPKWQENKLATEERIYLPYNLYRNE